MRPPHPPFSPRAGHQVVVFDNKLWLIGGHDGSDKNDVWSSADGSAWNQVTTTGTPANTPIFSPRAGHQVVVFDSKLWLIGGWDGNNNKRNDVWSSEDGETWNQVTTTGTPANTPIFSPRAFHQVVVFGNKLWLIGGYDGSSLKNDVWSSADGSAWNQVTTTGTPANTPIFSLRDRHQVVVFDEKLWLIGGEDDSGYRKNDVWRSADGITWNPVTATAEFDPRAAHQVVVFGNKLWLIGGWDGNKNRKNNDVWSSADGADWTQVTGEAAFSARQDHQVVVFKEKLWLIGGYEDIGYRKNDVWSSKDGITWKNPLHEQTVSLTFE